MNKLEEDLEKHLLDNGNGCDSSCFNAVIEFIKQDRAKQLLIHSVVNCVYVVTERDNYGEQILKGVFENRQKAVNYLTKDGLKESNIYEINEIELN